MLKRIIPYIKCVVFVVGMAGLISVIDFFFANTGYINYILRQAVSDEADYNGFVLGASHARCAINPVDIEEVTDDNILNMAIPGETIKDSYYLLQELDRKNDVERIILDIDYNYWFGNLGEGCFAEAFLYNQYSWTSPIKWKYLAENVEYLDFRNAISKRYVYTYKLKKIKANVNQKLSKDYQTANIYSLDTRDAGGAYTGEGFFALPLPEENPVGEKYLKQQMKIAHEDINPYPEKYFRKLVKYCKDNNIELLCVTSPITPTSMKRLSIDEAYGKLTALFDELGVTYYDFNKVKPQVLERKDTDYIDKEGHMGGELAYKYSEVLADVIEEHDKGTLDTSDYFYDSYEQMYESMED